MAMIVHRQSDGSWFAVEWQYVQGDVACFASDWFGVDKLDAGGLKGVRSGGAQTCLSLGQ